MTTYRSEADFEQRFGRERQADGRFSVISYLDYQGVKLVERFDGTRTGSWPAPWTAMTSARAEAASTRALGILASAGARLTGVGHPGRHPVRPAPGAGAGGRGGRGGGRYGYRELRSDKGHDAFLVEWDQLDGRAAGGARGLIRSPESAWLRADG